MPLTAIYLSVLYLTNRHKFRTSQHNDLTSRHYLKKCRLVRCYLNLSDNDVDLSDTDVDLSNAYVDLSDIMSTCQIILLSVGINWARICFQDLFSNK